MKKRKIKGIHYIGDSGILEKYDWFSNAVIIICTVLIIVLFVLAFKAYTC